MQGKILEAGKKNRQGQNPTGTLDFHNKKDLLHGQHMRLRIWLVISSRVKQEVLKEPRKATMIGAGILPAV